jgi:SecD/SecF fusion protein
VGARGFIAAGLAAIALAGCGGSDHVVKRTADCPIDHPAETLFYLARPTPKAPVDAASLDRTMQLMCERLKPLGHGAAGVTHGRTGEVALQVADKQQVQRASQAAQTARLEFYDWEPNVYGSPNLPTIGLYYAVRRASKQRPRAEATDIPPSGPAPSVKKRFGGRAQAIERYYDVQNDSGGDRYYLFGKDKQVIWPGQARSGAGVPAAGANGAVAYYSSRAAITKDFGGKPATGTRVLKVPRGITVVKAEQQTPAQASSLGYWVLEDDAELTGTGIEDPKQNFDPTTNEPIVTFTFTPAGRAAFARATKREADRGAQKIIPPGTPKDATFQRFAIVLDDQVVSLATISYVDNPEGISGSTGAQINGIGNLTDTQALAERLREGALPLDLQLVRVEP